MSSIAEKVDWKPTLDEAVGLFRELVRIDTTNAPDREGNEIEAAELLAHKLDAEGLEYDLLESAPGRGNIVTRIHGDGSGGGPILLNGHLDVVPADPAGWDHPPFGAEIHDGCIWGRGTIDMKNMVTMSVMCVILLKRLGVDPSRDVVFAGVADEEAGSRFGSMWLVDEHPGLVHAEYVLGELGGFNLEMSGHRFWPVQIAEKGSARLTIRTTGTPAHGSLPSRDNAVAKIAEAAARLGNRRLPHHVTAVARDFIEMLAEKLPTPRAQILRAVLNPRLSGLVLDRVLPDRDLAAVFDALTHNTANPTIIAGGDKINQIPARAELRVDGRTLPGYDAEDLVHEVRHLIGDGYAIEIEIDESEPAVVADADNEIMHEIERVLTTHDPGAVVLPNLIPGFTDAKAYSKLGSTCIGFSPLRLGPEMSFTKMFHGDNERIPVKGFHFGMRALFEVVANLVTRG